MDYIIAKNTKLKEWYAKNFPSDDAADTINEGKTFYDLFKCLDRHGEIYSECMGDSVDSVIRERLFTKLAEIMNVTYDYIYNQWLGV